MKIYFQVENRGPSDIESAEVYILWPSLRGQDQPLLYLTGQPIVEGPGSCHYVSDVNTHNIKVSGVAIYQCLEIHRANSSLVSLYSLWIPDLVGLLPFHQVSHIRPRISL